LVGVLLFASPAISLFFPDSVSEEFSELYLLGPQHTMADIPFNIVQNDLYTVYLGVGNHMGTSQYYTCQIKLRTEVEPLKNETLVTASPIGPLYEYNVFLKNGASWEAPLTFRVNILSFDNDSAQIESIVINGIEFTVNRQVYWDSEKMGFYFNVLVELWVYNATKGITEFHNRSVHFYLNATQLT